MNPFERLYVATMKAIDVFFSTISPEPKINVEERIRHSELVDGSEDPCKESSLERP